MTELKTLKDLILKHPNFRTGIVEISPNELRQEAIKWCHKIKKDSDNWMSEGIVRRSIYEWIKKFFNLTEEDLK